LVSARAFGRRRNGLAWRGVRGLAGSDSGIGSAGAVSGVTPLPTRITSSTLPMALYASLKASGLEMTEPGTNDVWLSMVSLNDIPVASVLPVFLMTAV